MGVLINTAIVKQEGGDRIVANCQGKKKPSWRKKGHAGHLRMKNKDKEKR